MNIGIYVHIPFCLSKCHYCDFASYANLEYEYEVYIDALINEIKAYTQSIKEPIVAKTIFVGGGTPSVLPPFLLEKLLIALKQYLIFDQNIEYTLETNPGTLTLEKLDIIKKHGINRISIGLQAYQNNLLKKIGRIHTREQFIKNYELCKEAGFNNISVDLMFGLPGQSLQDWEETLLNVIKLEPEHISAYSLIVEEGTLFGDLYNKGKLELIDEDTERSMYHYAKTYLEENGYQQYEISNFAKKDKESKHNILYWRTLPYIGVGLGAHSYYKDTRYHNTYEMKEYLKNSNDLSEIQKNKEFIDPKTAMAEYMFLGLRLNSGVLDEDFKNKFGYSIMDIYGQQITRHIKEGLLKREKGKTTLTDFGQDVSNIVFSSFL